MPILKHCYGTDHPQLKQYTCVTCMCVVCAKAKNMGGIKPCVYTHVNKCTTPHTYPHEVSTTKRSSLQPVASALSFIIYACRTILRGIVTNILGHPRPKYNQASNLRRDLASFCHMVQHLVHLSYKCPLQNSQIQLYSEK